MDQIQKVKIGIIGGGIAGLSVALSLHKAGFPGMMTIYERDDCFERRRQGYGLTMLQGLSALRRLGVYESVKAIDTPSRSHYIFDCDGNIINFFGTIFWPAASPGKGSKYNLHISRQNLRNILWKELSRLRPGAVQWDKRLVSINKASHSHHLWELVFADGNLANVDVVIGCDGINSFVRRHKYPLEIDHPLKYLGMILVLGITRTTHYLSKERVFQTVDGSTRLFAMPFYGDQNNPHENIMWQLSFPIDERTARELVGNLNLLKETVLARCEKWHAPIPSLIGSTELSLLTGIPAYDRDPSPPLNSINDSFGLVLLGDAAHPMSPFKGQGANQALLDGVSFADHFVRVKDVDDAIRSFEAEMWTRVSNKVLASRERVTTFHQPDVLDGECFFYRGVSRELLQNLKTKGINSASGEQIEDLIISELNS